MTRSMTVQELSEQLVKPGYEQVSKIVTIYEALTGVAFPIQGRTKFLPRVLTPVFRTAVSLVRDGQARTYRQAIEHAIVAVEVERQHTTPVELSAALVSVTLARDALTRQLQCERLTRQNADRVTGLLADLQERTSLLQQLLPQLDDRVPEAWTPETAQVLVTTLKVLADATGSLLETDQLLYAHLEHWQKKDDRAHKTLREFAQRWQEAHQPSQPVTPHLEQETPMSDSLDSPPSDEKIQIGAISSTEGTVDRKIWTTKPPPYDELDLLPVLPSPFGPDSAGIGDEDTSEEPSTEMGEIRPLPVRTSTRIRFLASNAPVKAAPSTEPELNLDDDLDFDDELDLDVELNLGDD